MPGLNIHVLDLQWTDLGMRYYMDEVWPQLAQANLDAAHLVFTPAHFRAYDWTHQEIWLSETGVARLGPAEAAFLLHALGRAFVVTLDGERLYGGVFYPPVGAAALHFPVMHALGQPLEFLRIRPAQGSSWAPQAPHLAAQCRVIANPAIESWLAREGLLREIPASRRPSELTN